MVGRFRTAATLAAVLGCAAAQATTDVVVAAASSLTDVLTEVAKGYETEHPGARVRLTFGSSGALRRQIELGAPIDIFVAASKDEMDKLGGKRLIQPLTRIDIASNRLVLVQPAGGSLKGWKDLSRVSRLAIANPETVPAGKYAKQTLEARGLWKLVSRKAIFGNTVRQTLSYVASGNADAGIVFATDARTDKRRVRWVANALPIIDHRPILYPAAVLKGAATPKEASSFVRYLASPSAQRIFRRYGFGPGGR